MNVFFNQARNAQMTFGSRRLEGIRRCLCGEVTEAPLSNGDAKVGLLDARSVKVSADVWFADPPYADAINYHALTDCFLACYERLLQVAFPDRRFQDAGALAVQRSGDDFKRAMVDIYANLARHMPEDGMHFVRFTRQNPDVWGDLGMILWAGELKVTAAWTISTETAAGGIKKGKYVHGTVNLVLRKRTKARTAWLDGVYPLIGDEVRRQLDSMRALDDESEPDFGDTDYQLAAYAAALGVLTQFADFEGMNCSVSGQRARSRSSRR